MARNPKQDANLKPIQKGDLSSEELKKRQSNGGKKSGEVRRAKRDARSAARYVLELAAKGQIKDNLKNLGLPDNEQTNMAALQARLFTMALNGNLDAYLTLMKVAGYDPEEIRKERESLASDRRRDLEVDAKVSALNANPESAGMALNMGNEDGGTDVIVYVPKMLSEEDCMADDAGEDEIVEGEAEDEVTES